ncbi:MAG TPA: M14 family zinc carboxypeptidase [Gemmatimonadaceae bacterium]|nr:M14 family zinc carboxypeptidase [Gemmatimonadaceae bacterium]
MTRSTRMACSAFAVATVAALALCASPARAQQKNDEEYTKLIKQFLRDPRITTELVDHLPASNTVPTPLKHFGHIIGAWGILDKGEDMNRYLEKIAKAAPGRAKYWSMGKSEEGRDMGVIVIASEESLRNLDKYKADLAALTDPRKTTEAQAQQLIKRGKPMYWITSGMHSPETGGPEMLMELAYRLVVEETPLIQQIRNNVITVISPVVEMDGRERVVDAYNYSKAHAASSRNQLMMYWGKYVQHDNNRDGMGQFLALTRNIEKFGLEWHPTILHDLHEAQTLLYASTGTGPYNEQLDAITIDEWWTLAENDVLEMTKRGVPGVWTYGFYDGWVPNYMFFVAHAHNAVGRFYEVQSYGPDTTTVRITQSREWFRPNPTPPVVAWGPRNNTNIQESAILFALSRVAKDRDTFLENYWIKNKRAVARGTDGPTYGWVIPASQRRKADAADAVNELLDQGLEFHTASSAFKAGSVDVKRGDYIVRGDQPYRTVADIYFSVQRYPAGNPSPYDDTGWTFQYMRDLVIVPVTDKSLLSQAMTPVKGHVTAAGGLNGSGPVIVVEHTGDNNIVTFRYKLKDVKMAAAEDDFDAAGHHFRAGAIVIQNANAPQVESELRQLGLSGWAMAAAPSVKTHDLDIPRILYLHSWSRTQDEGWVRAAFETYGVPFTYMGDKELAKMGNLRSRFDVVVYPHIGGNAASIVAGVAMTGTAPIPYKKSAETPAFGLPDSTDDIRGGMGIDGLMNLYRFVQEGGTLITEGATAALFPEYNLTPGITVETPSALFARGTIVRGMITDMKSPLVYGIADNQLPVYFSQAPVLNAGGAGGAGGRGGGRGNPCVGGGYSQNTQPMSCANMVPVSTIAIGDLPSPMSGATATDTAAGGRGGRGGGGRGGRGSAAADAPATTGAGAGAAAGGGGGGGFGGRGGAADTGPQPRVVVRFPTDTTQILLSGALAGAEALSGRAQLVDSQIGKGHVVMFAMRPFWRWQTQGTYFLGFNAILNWNDLDAGKAAPPPVVP